VKSISDLKQMEKAITRTAAILVFLTLIVRLGAALVAEKQTKR